MSIHLASFELPADKLLKLLRPPYGLPDSGDYWAMTFSIHLTEDLDLIRTTGDPACFYKQIDDRLAGLTCPFVNNALHAVDPSYQKLCERIEKQFQCSPREYDNVNCAGIQIETKKVRSR